VRYRSERAPSQADCRPAPDSRPPLSARVRRFLCDGDAIERATSLALTVTLVSSVTLACGGAPPRTAKVEEVPANSASEEHMSRGGKPKPEEPRPREAETGSLTTPLTTDASQANGGAGATGNGGAGNGGHGAKPAKGGKEPAGKAPPTPATGAKGGEKVSRTECGGALDRYLDLAIGADGRFGGLPPELVAQMKAQGFAQAGAKNPCDSEGMTRTQHSCAMGASSTAAWQACFPK